MSQRCFGWIKDQHDASERRYGLSHVTGATQTRLDLTKHAPSMRDQFGESCVGYGLAAIAYGKQSLEGLDPVYPSPGFVWYNARKRWNDELLNVGTYPRTGIQVINDFGLPAEKDWSCKELPFRFNEEPDRIAYTSGYDARFEIEHAKVDADRAAVQSAMVSYGPLAFGMPVHEGYADLGSHDIVERAVGEYKGNHYQALFGYDEDGVFVQNSWGSFWGNAGWARIEWGYFLSVADDIVGFTKMPRIE